MKELSKQQQKQIIKLEKLYKESHVLMNKIQIELLQLGLNKNTLNEELLSLRVGDSTADDFINYVKSELDYLNN